MSPSTDTTVRATIAQLDPVLGDVESNQATVESVLDDAKAAGSDIVVFPELFLTGYHIGDDAARLTEAATQALEEIRTMTDDIVAVVGTPTFGESGIYNSAVVLGDGETKGTYHKTHRYGVENDTFLAGEEFPTVDTDVGTLGVQICYDVEFPEVSRQLTLNGADLLVTISANMRPCIPDQELYHGTRAIENGRPHLLCNRVGAERGVDFFGNSGIVDYRGRRVLSLGTDRSETTAASVETDPDRTQAHDYLGDRRPNIYGL